MGKGSYSHLFLSGDTTEAFKYKSSGMGSTNIPERDRASYGDSLNKRFSAEWEKSKKVDEEREAVLPFQPSPPL